MKIAVLLMVTTILSTPVFSMLSAAERFEQFAATHRIDDSNFKKRREFERKSFFTPSRAEKQAHRAARQMLLDKTIGKDTDSSLMTFQVVKGIPEIDRWLISNPTPKGTHRLVIFDCDEALFPGSAMSWIDAVFKHLHRFKNQDAIAELLLQYGFSSLSEFAAWGNAHTPTPANFDGMDLIFSAQRSIIDDHVPQILRTWRKQGINIHGLTARYSDDGTLFETRKSFHEVELDFRSLQQFNAHA